MKIEFEHEKLTEQDLRELIEVLYQQDVEDGMCFSLTYKDKEMKCGCAKGSPIHLIDALTAHLAQVHTDWKPGLTKREVRKLIKLNAKLLANYMGFFLEKGRTDKE